MTEELDIEEEKLCEPGAYLEEINDFFNAEHISDGLPIIPPTKARYEKMMEYCPFEESIGAVQPQRTQREDGYR